MPVSQSTPVITWATPGAVTVGAALSSSQLDATANVAGTFTYSPAAGTMAWSIGVQGVEETSVGFVIAPPSGPTLLLSSMGDIYGFAHQTLTQSPAQGMYSNPRAKFAQHAGWVRVDRHTQPVYGLCMATKTISIETDAYELLAREKQDSRESFSRVIRRLFAERPALTAGDLLDGMESFKGKGAGPRRKRS